MHGSISTNEIIAYSDFDGLIIIRDKFEDTKILNDFISKSNKLIIQFDPLQHHSWFIIKESMLLNYDTTYFPVELFKFSKTIYPCQSIKLNIRVKDKIDFSKPFYNLINSITTDIKSQNYLNNAYELKSFLSKIMLLPCFYLQAKLRHGVNKKESFDLAKNDFKNSSWSCIDISSDIRSRWDYEINWIQKKMALSNNKIIKLLFKRKLAPKINPKIKTILTENFKKSLVKLINQMKKNLNK